MSNMEKIMEKVRHRGYVTSKLVREEGIGSWYLSDMVRKGKLERVSRGVYVPKKGVYDEYFVFQYHHSKAIYSYSNALFLHGLTEEIPTHLEVSVYQGYNPHRFDDGVIVHYVKKAIHELGVIEMDSPFGNPIRVYDKERTLCDLVVSKRIVESEVYKKAFQSYFRQSDNNVKKLMKYATEMGIETEMFTLVEVLSQ